MKKYRLLILVGLVLLAFIGLASVIKNRVSGETLNKNYSAGKNLTLHFRNEFAVPTTYANEAANLFGNKGTRALSLASADFDEDGMPDLIAGYGAGEKGILAIQRGRVDSLFPSAAEQKAIDEGVNFPSPFKALTPVFELPAQPDFAVAGDFDADGHFDLITAQRGDDKIFMLAGDGRGGFAAPEEMALGGALTALAAGEINRRDGLTDIVIGITGEKPQVLVFESPEGAFRAAPEIFDLPETASSFAFGQFDADFGMDLAVADGRNLTVIYGRDRKLSYLGDNTKIAAARLASQTFDFEIKSVAAVNCGLRGAGCDLAMLGADGAIHFLENKPQGFLQTGEVRLPLSQMPENPLLTTARVSALESDDLIVLDQSNKKIYVVNSPERGEKIQNNAQPIASLDSPNPPVAVLPMRLNKDGLSDLVILRAGETALGVLLTTPTAVFTVNSTGNEADFDAADGVCLTMAGTCTFRAAREQAQYCPQPGPNPCGRNDEIRFNLPSSGTSVIDTYPVLLNHTITIDGYTQTGAAPNTLTNGDNAILKVQIKGSGGGLATGVAINSSNSVVRGLSFTDFCAGGGIGLGGTGNNIAEGNFTGTDPAGTAHVGCNGSFGVVVSSNNNTVGGTTPQARNLLADTTRGIYSWGSNNLFQGNFIGTDRTGTLAIGGGGTGVYVTSDPSNTGTGNTIGGTAPGARNIISGHNPVGVGIQIQSSSNLVQGNYIGVDITGAKALKNDNQGIEITGLSVTVGGTTPAARNIISANGNLTFSPYGVGVGGSNSLVQGNFIGTDVTGSITDPDGVPGNGDELGNRGYGILTCDGPSCGSISNITIGGTVAGARNVISGNTSDGVFVGNGANPANHLVAGNLIGTDVTGTLPRGNGGNGLTDASMGSIIGGTQVGARNVISANAGNGILIGGFRNSIVQGNYIGLQSDGFSPLGNAQHGVFANGSHGATIGGTTAGAGNRIAYNGGDGVHFIGFFRQVAILGNAIFSNSLLGIELLDSANSNQPAPVLTSTTLAGGNATISGTLTAAANTQFRIEFFANHTCDPSGAGEGQTLIGVANVTTNGGGIATIAPTFPYSVQLGNFITATATDPNGNTSKFSTCFRTAAKSVDYEGDGRTDLAIFRPSNGQWWYLKSSNNSAAALTFGVSTDRIVPADYTGDGKTDIAVWRPSTGEWFILRSEDFSFYSVPFGTNGDVPVPGDYDGDAKSDIAVFRPSTATWFIQKSSGGTSILTFGLTGDIPVVGDYDGDGKADIAIYRPTVGEWWYARSSDGEVRALQFGSSQDKPVPADYSGDGRTDIAVWRPSTGEWFILRSENLSFYSIPFGQTGDVPTPGDYDGDGHSDIAVFRSGTWFLQQSTAGISIVQFGIAGDKPVQSAYIP